MHPLLVPIFFYLCIYPFIIHVFSAVYAPLEYKFRKKSLKNCEHYRWYMADSFGSEAHAHSH